MTADTASLVQVVTHRIGEAILTSNYPAEVVFARLCDSCEPGILRLSGLRKLVNGFAPDVPAHVLQELWNLHDLKGEGRAEYPDFARCFHLAVTKATGDGAAENTWGRHSASMPVHRGAPQQGQNSTLLTSAPLATTTHRFGCSGAAWFEEFSEQQAVVPNLLPLPEKRSALSRAPSAGE
eukprot:TRINITY_DN4202_c2_g1_i2.p1 TRINITY_DN4202_c2_g1~~TRINITY_DN4202_c2_g1_i2.p1  ORF type:complete len:180 (-),score=29.56 TRINITY_DN4202_c2_g1_i2:35-574(-)